MTRRAAPGRAARFRKGCFAGQANIGEEVIVQIRQLRTLAASRGPKRQRAEGMLKARVQ